MLAAVIFTAFGCFSSALADDMATGNVTGGKAVVNKLVSEVGYSSVRYDAENGLPTARLVWHCPYIDIFYSDDGKVNGANYRDFTLMRLDGEYRECDGASENSIIVNKSDSFEGWVAWKKHNKEGFDCSITLTKKGNSITAVTQNMGLSVKCVTTINDGTDTIYIALTGDQCAITNIRINK